MTTYPTAYVRPTSLDEASQLLQQTHGIALAGGALLFGRADLPYETVIDLSSVPDLRHITVDQGISLGGAVYLQEVVDSADVPPILKRSLTRALPLNIRNHASVGETLMLENPPAEWLAALAVMDAVISAVDQNGQRHSDSVVTCASDPQRVQRRALIIQIQIPTLGEAAMLGAGFVARTPADSPIVNAAARIVLEGRRVTQAVVALGGASEAPVIRLELSTLVGQPFDEANIASAVKLVAPSVNPVADYRGSAEYRREMARVTAQRALLDCLSQLT